MILALDVHYREDRAKSVGILFNWEDYEPRDVITEYLTDVGEYIPGEFYKRELPCLLKVIGQTDIRDIDMIIVDGYVYIDNERQLGLGGKLYEALGQRIPIIGVAKTSFLSNKETVVEIRRGESKNPLFISSIGVDIDLAASLVGQMKGVHRIPELLKLLDRRTKEI